MTDKTASEAASSLDLVIKDAGLQIGLGVLSLVVAVITGGIFTWRYRDAIGALLRKRPVLHYLIVLAGLIAGGIAGFLLEGVNPSRFVRGSATSEELRIYAWLWLLAIVCVAVAFATAAESLTVASEITGLEEKLGIAERRADKAEREAAFAGAVNRMFLTVVGKKTERFLECGDELRDMTPTTPGFVTKIHQAHGPYQQCIELLAATWSIFELHLTELVGHTTPFKLRIALFRVDHDMLEVELSTDGRRAGIVKGPARHSCKPHYCIGEPRGQSLAVQTAFSQEIVIESDATLHVDQLRTSYRPHDDSHHRRIHSIMGIPLGLPRQIGEPCQRVLCVDTDIGGGFRHDDISRFENIRDNLEQRLLIEIIQRAAFQQPPSERVRPRGKGEKSGKAERPPTEAS